MLFHPQHFELGPGFVVAVSIAFLTAIIQALTGHGLDVASYDWDFIIKATIAAASLSVARVVGTCACADGTTFQGAICCQFGGARSTTRPLLIGAHTKGESWSGRRQTPGQRRATQETFHETSGMEKR